jgi:hypothetical protein
MATSSVLNDPSQEKEIRNVSEAGSVSIIRCRPEGEKKVLGRCISSCGFCLRRLSPNRNCMFALYNKHFIAFGFLYQSSWNFRFELMVRNFQDKTLECQVEEN